MVENKKEKRKSKERSDQVIVIIFPFLKLLTFLGLIIIFSAANPLLINAKRKEAQVTIKIR